MKYISAETFIAYTVSKLAKNGDFEITEEKISKLAALFSIEASKREKTFVSVSRGDLSEFADNHLCVSYSRLRDTLSIKRDVKSIEEATKLGDTFKVHFEILDLTKDYDIVFKKMM